MESQIPSQSFHKNKYTILISVLLLFFVGIILIGNFNSVTGAMGGGPGATPYMVSPYAGTSNIFGRDNTAPLIAAIPEKIGMGTSKSITEVRFTYYYGDSPAGTTLTVRDPSNPAIPKWIDSSDYFKEGSQNWTNISASGFTTEGGFTFKNNNYNIATGVYRLNPGVIKVSAEVDVLDGITGTITTHKTAVKATYIRSA